MHHDGKRMLHQKRDSASSSSTSTTSTTSTHTTSTTTTRAAPPPPIHSTTPSTTSTTPTSTTSASSLSSSPSSTSSNFVPTTQNNPLLFSFTPPGFTPPPTGTNSDNSSPTDLPPNSDVTNNSPSHVGTIVGVVAAVLAGIIVIGAAASYIMRRKFKKGSESRFDRADYIRNSIMLQDEATSPDSGAADPRPSPLAMARANYNPRPPTMIERHLGRNKTTRAQAAADIQMRQTGAAADGYGYEKEHDAGYYDTGYYDQQTQGQYGQHPQQGQQYPYYDATPPPPQAAFESQPKGRETLTPYQQQQYAEITRQLDSASPSQGGDHETADYHSSDHHTQEYYGSGGQGITSPEPTATFSAIGSPTSPTYPPTRNPFAADAVSYGQPSSSRSLPPPQRSPRSPPPVASTSRAPYMASASDGRSGTPVDPNPQQTFFAPERSAGKPRHRGGRGAQEEEDVYGGM